VCSKVRETIGRLSLWEVQGIAAAYLGCGLEPFLSELLVEENFSSVFPGGRSWDPCSPAVVLKTLRWPEDLTSGAKDRRGGFDEVSLVALFSIGKPGGASFNGGIGDEEGETQKDAGGEHGLLGSGVP